MRAPLCSQGGTATPPLHRGRAGATVGAKYRSFCFQHRLLISRPLFSSFTVDAAAGTEGLTLDPRGVVCDGIAVKKDGAEVADLGTLTVADLNQIGNVSAKLIRDFPAVNAGSTTDTTRAGMMVAKANGGASSDILGIVTPPGTTIASFVTTTPLDSAFNNAALPTRMSFP